MKIHKLVQGSSEWHALRAQCFTASEASAMMGASKYQSRTDLLKQKKTGEVSEVSPAQQRLFDKGHAAEAAMRPFAESIINDELYPATATSDEHPDLLASFDGITMLEDTCFEHKLINANLRSATAETLDEHYKIQMDQQLLVSGSDRCLFMASDGTEEDCNWFWYETTPKRMQALVDGWNLFKQDLAVFEVKPEAAKVEAAPVKDLPVISYQFDGKSLTTNLDTFRAAAEKLVADSQLPMETDQDFADRENLCKSFKEAEAKIKSVQDNVLGEIQDIDAFVKDLKYIGEQIRQARLNSERAIKSRKEEIRNEIVANAEKALSAHNDALQASISGVTVPRIRADFWSAIKGKRTLSSLKDAADAALSHAKLESNAVADQIRTNLVTFEQYNEFAFLFADLSELVVRDAEYFVSVVKNRINEHKEAEQKRLDAERERIRSEEQDKAEAEAARKAEETEAFNEQQIKSFQKNQTEEDLPHTTDLVEQAEQPAPRFKSPDPSNPSPQRLIANYLVDNTKVDLVAANMIADLILTNQIPCIDVRVRDDH